MPISNIRAKRERAALDSIIKRNHLNKLTFFFDFGKIKHLIQSLK